MAQCVGRDSEGQVSGHDGVLVLTVGDTNGAGIVCLDKKTGKLLCVYEGVRTLGVGAEISALIAESADLIYHLLVVLHMAGLGVQDVLQTVTASSAQVSGAMPRRLTALRR